MKKFPLILILLFRDFFKWSWPAELNSAVLSCFVKNAFNHEPFAKKFVSENQILTLFQLASNKNPPIHRKISENESYLFC